MSDYVHNDRAPRLAVTQRTLESRAMFAACFALCLARAALARLTPWRKRATYRGRSQTDSMIGEAHNAASVMVASSFMGL